MTSISIIIPVKKINNYIRKEIIPALKKQTFKNFELIIIPDKIGKKEKFPSFVKIIASWPKTGPANKRDLGVKKAKGSIIAFLDDDAYPAKDWLKKAMPYFKNPKIAAVCGPGITPPKDNSKQKISGLVWQTWLGAGGNTYRCSPGKKREVDDYPTFNLLVRKSDFKKVGGFDSHFWPGEDSLPPDEEILIINHSNRLKKVKIGELVDRHLKSSRVHKDSKSEITYGNPKNFAVFSFDSNYKIRIKPIKAFIRHRKSHKIYELKLTRGNTIQVTNSHSLFTFNDEGKISPIKVNQLKPGNLIVTPRKITISRNIRNVNIIKLLLSIENKFIYNGKRSLLYVRSKEYITYLSKHYRKNFLEAVDKYNLKGNLANWKYYGILPLIVLKNLPVKSYRFQLLKKFKVKISARGHGNVARMKSTVSMTKDFLWLLGFISAEGWIGNPDKIKTGNKWNINISQREKNKTVLERARKILKSHLELSFSLYKDKRYNVLSIIVNCRVLWCLLKALELDGYSYQKRVPSFIFSLPKEKIKAFLEGYHDGDSCDYTDGRLGKLGITTSSPEMAKDFTLLFLRLGEPCRITKHKENRKPHYHDQFNVHTFCPSIKKLGVNTQLRIERNLQDGIPAIDYLLKISKKYHLTSKLIKMKLTPQYPNKRDNRKKVTWYHVKKFVKVVKKLVGNVPEVRILEKILNSDLRFEEILEIKEAKKQPRYTYDLSVGGAPEADNFIAGNFVCTHNTKLCHDLVHKINKRIIYDPEILVYHHRREIFTPHLKQISRFGLHRGFFAKILPKTSKRIGYFLPLFFFLWLLITPPLIFVLEVFQFDIISIPLFFLYLFSIFIYLGLLLATAIQVWKKQKEVKLALLLIPAIVTTHLIYGLMFAKGLLIKKLRQ